MEKTKRNTAEAENTWLNQKECAKMQVIQVEVYTFDELPDKYKEKAIQNYQHAMSPEDFRFDMQMVEDNAIESLKEIRIDIDHEDFIWDAEEYVHFGMKISYYTFNHLVENICEEFVETHPGITEVDWSLNYQHMVTRHKRSYLDDEFIDVSIWDNNCGSSSERYQSEIKDLKDKMLDAVEPQFNKIMKILDQAEEDMIGDYNYRYSEECAIVYFKDEGTLFNAYGEEINTEVLQPMQDNSAPRRVKT